MKSILILAISIFLSQLALSQNTSTFQNLISKLNNEAANDRAGIFEEYLASIGQTPIIEDNKVFWVAKGGINQPPYILADFNGFLNPRYIEDNTIGEMKNIDGTNWYYFEKEMLPNAIVNYLFKLDEKTFTDPLNPQVQISFGGMYSVLKMPHYQFSQETVLNQFYPKGALIKDSIYSKHLEHTRIIHIYLPPHYKDLKEPLSSAYFHDGSFSLREGFFPQILDNLIAEQKIKPIVAIFDDPVIRGKEYRGDEAYRNYLKNELIPFISKKYNVKKDTENRAIFGWSRGGMSSIYVSHSLDLFGKLGAFSPAISSKDFNEFISELENYNHSPEQIFITGSIYDHIWYNDALLLKEYFQKNKSNFQYLEIPAGHNIPAWRTLLDEIMIAFFPY